MVDKLGWFERNTIIPLGCSRGSTQCFNHKPSNQSTSHMYSDLPVHLKASTLFPLAVAIRCRSLCVLSRTWGSSWCKGRKWWGHVVRLSLAWIYKTSKFHYFIYIYIYNREQTLVRIYNCTCIRKSVPVLVYGYWMMGWSAGVFSSSLPRMWRISLHTWCHLDRNWTLHCVPSKYIQRCTCVNYLSSAVYL